MQHNYIQPPAVGNGWRPYAHNNYAKDFTDAQLNTKTIEKRQLSITREIRWNHKSQTGTEVLRYYFPAD